MDPRPLSAQAATERASRLAEGATRAVLGITGPPGAGKSTLAAQVCSAVPGAVLVPMDGFHLAQTVLDASGLADRKGAPETFDRAGYVALLRRITEQHRDDPTIYAPTFRRDIEEPISGAIAVPATCPLVVTEGNYLLHWPELRPLLDEVWWLEVDDKTRIERLVSRHIGFGRSPAEARAWVMRSDEANTRLIAPRRDLADVVVAVP